ncbi:MAG TPA: D-alanyl-D-alanine carboxypeptidase family protein [Rubrobacteraceae bacterium]|nr:D-alanyl-D-alanine carboxypeptidase family protein [Rubrobacteraceae bacterium]
MTLAILVAALVLMPCGGTLGLAQETTAPEPSVAGQSSPEPSVPGPSAPEVDAGAWTLMDIRTGEYLAGENAEKQLPMASTTKIMLALLTFEEANLDEEVVISQKAASFAVPLYSNVGLFPSDTVSVRELLMASLIASGDDAAYALAEHLGDGSVERFVEEMNDKAEELDLDDTRFENPVGFDARDHHSSARDLAKMTRRAFEYPEFRRIVATRETAITTQDHTIPLVNTNDLLFTYTPTTGVKTGTTPAAGPSLVASAATGDESYITVVLDDEERFADTITLLEHGFEAYDRRDLVVEDKRYARVNVPYRRGERIGLVARDDVTGLVAGDPKVERKIELVQDLPGSVRPGARLGRIVVRVDGERVGETALVARRGYEEASLGEKLWYTVEGIFE